VSADMAATTRGQAPMQQQRPREADLLAAATRLFRARGFHATSMQDLGEALGMNRGSLYHYITGKDDLLWAVFCRAFDLLEARVVPVLESDVAPVDRLRLAIREHLRVAADHADELSLIQIELRSLTPDRQVEMVARRDAYEARWRTTITAGVTDGSLRPVDVRMAGIGILSVSNWFTQWFHPDGPMDVDTVAGQLCDLFLEGLLPRADGTAPVVPVAQERLP
jgi:AcrR family transcriptional regulator